jgi:hypothetical protein
MAYQLSTGLRDKLMSTGSLSSIMNLGFIYIYSGAVPANADAALTGTQLCKVSNNSTATGLTMDPSVGGVLPKKASEVWSGLNGATGTASYFRWVGSADTGALSTTEPRIQGLVGTVGTDMNLSSVSLTSGATQTIDTFNWTLPTY